MNARDLLKEKLTDPNFLTLFRIAAAPGIILVLLLPNRFTSILAALLFILASISDYFDGYFARKRGMVSNFGKVMDPVADKLLTSSAFIMLVGLDRVPAWIVCVIIGRELAITGLRVVVVETGRDVSASWLGKYKTGCQIAAIIPLLIHYPYFGIHFHAVGSFFLILALVLTVWSGADYFLRFRKLLES